MAEFLDLELEESVTDMNLEARLEKELLLHGCQRRDMSENDLAYLRSVLENSDQNAVIPLDFWAELDNKVKKIETPDVEPDARFQIGERVWVTENVVVNGGRCGQESGKRVD